MKLNNFWWKLRFQTLTKCAGKLCIGWMMMDDSIYTIQCNELNSPRHESLNNKIVIKFTLEIINWCWCCCVNRGLYHVINFIFARFLELNNVLVGGILYRVLAVIFTRAVIVVVILDYINISTKFYSRSQCCCL